MFRRSMRGLAASLGLLVVTALVMAHSGAFSSENFGVAVSASFALGFSGMFHS